jgi:hypothetical protein
VPVTYKIEADKRTIRTKCIGFVTLDEVIDHFRTLQQDPDCPDHLNVFLNLSEVDSLPGTSPISTVINEVKKLRGRVRFSACAILATRDALFGMMRVFEVMGEEYFRVMRTFRVANGAEAWRGSRQSLAHRPREQARVRSGRRYVDKVSC